jgi:hypothetical protein
VPLVRRAIALRSALEPTFGAVAPAAQGSEVVIPVSSRARGWALASYLIARAQTLGLSYVSYAGIAWSTGSTDGWQPAERTRDLARVSVG